MKKITISLDRLEYIARINRVRFEAGSNITIVQECNKILEEFEKEFDVEIINDFLVWSDE